MHPGYTILDHPADLGIEARGKTIAEAFEQSSTALVSIILDTSTIDLREERMLSISASDIDHLLVRWLTEVLYLYDGLHFAPRDFRITDISQSHLSAIIRGEDFLPGKHRTKLDVKAVTYHQLSVSKMEDGVVVRVFLDI